jgi:hypothetical protein
MSKYTPAVTREFNIEGDVVKVKFRRLTREQFGKLSPFMTSEGMTAERSMEMMDVCSQFLPDVITNFEGLTDANGEPLGTKELFEEAYFFPLLADIIGAIVEESTINEKKQNG